MRSPEKDHEHANPYMGVDARCSKNVIMWRRACSGDGCVFCTINPYTSGRAGEAKCPAHLRCITVSMKLYMANVSLFTWQKWACIAESKHASRWLRRLAPYRGSGLCSSGRCVLSVNRKGGRGLQTLEKPIRASATKTWSSSCAPRTGILSFSFRTICLMMCIATSSVITNTPIS